MPWLICKHELQSTAAAASELLLHMQGNCKLHTCSILADLMLACLQTVCRGGQLTTLTAVITDRHCNATIKKIFRTYTNHLVVSQQLRLILEQR